MYDFPDENDPAGKDFDTYDCYPAKAARTLKQRWLAYNAQEAALKANRPEGLLKGLLNSIVLKVHAIRDSSSDPSSKSGGRTAQVHVEHVRKLKQPPVDPIDVAQGFQSAATGEYLGSRELVRHSNSCSLSEFYFWKMCKDFNPDSVQPD